MSTRPAIDVYGRFRAHTKREAGVAWTRWRVGGDGKQNRLPDVTVEPDAIAGAIVDAPEAAFHELARPGSQINAVSER